jgi:hypothetical protein
MPPEDSHGLRVSAHPVLGPLGAAPAVTFYFEGRPISARLGEPIAAALIAAGVSAFRTTAKYGDPRGIFCGIGRCTDCMMVVDGVPNVRTCVTPVTEGISVERQLGRGERSDG